MSEFEVIIGDLHARPSALAALLHTLGAIDRRGRRRRGWWIVQVGDLLDRHAAPAANAATAQLAQETVDVVLAGNHEARMLADPSGEHGAALAALAGHGWPLAAVASGDWLITHAGLHPALAAGLPPTAQECADAINDRWSPRPPRLEDPLFGSIGPARGGDCPFGGILWMHVDEWPKSGRTPYGQISGHVPQRRKPRLLPGQRWAIDLGGRGGRLGAVVRERGKRRWHPVVVEDDARAALAGRWRRQLEAAAA